MKTLLKIFVAFCLLFTLLLSTAFASNSAWKNPDYNFSNIDTLKLSKIIIEVPSVRRLEPDVAIANRVKYALKKELQDRHINLYIKNVVVTNKFREEDFSPLEENTSNTAISPSKNKTRTLAQIRAENAPLVTVKVHNLGIATVHHKAWKEHYTYNRRVTRKVSYIDYRGHKRYRDEIVTIPERRTKHHPAYDTTTAYAELSFFVRDPKTDNEVIFTIHDSRSREFETDTTGMLNRICNLFAKKVSR